MLRFCQGKRYMHWSIHGLLVVGCLGLGACVSAPEQTAARRAEVADAAYERTQQTRVRIPPEPDGLRTDYSDPADAGGKL